MGRASFPLLLLRIIWCCSQAEAIDFITHHYRVESKSLTTNQAYVDAHEQNGYVVTITSSAEASYLENVLSSGENQLQSNAWIGASDAPFTSIYGTQMWRWNSETPYSPDGQPKDHIITQGGPYAAGPGTHFTSGKKGSAGFEVISGQYENWATNQPDHADMGEELDIGSSRYQDCASLDWNNYQWSDFPCDGNKNYRNTYIIEYDDASDVGEVNFQPASLTRTWSTDWHRCVHRFSFRVDKDHHGSDVEVTASVSGDNATLTLTCASDYIPESTKAASSVGMANGYGISILPGGCSDGTGTPVGRLDCRDIAEFDAAYCPKSRGYRFSQDECKAKCLETPDCVIFQHQTTYGVCWIYNAPDTTGSDGGEANGWTCGAKTTDFGRVHLAPKGAQYCDYGHAVPAEQCLDAAWMLLPPGRSMKRTDLVKGNGTCGSFNTVVPEYTESHASSVAADDVIGTGAGRGQLDSPQAWSALVNQAGEWWQMDLGSMSTIAGVVTQGREDEEQYVRSYKVQVSSDGSSWSYVDAGHTFTGHSAANRMLKKENLFANPTFGRYVRIVVQSWTNHISMRAGVTVCTALHRYKFVISAPHASTIGLHIRNIEFVGASLSDLAMVPAKLGDYCVNSNLRADRNDASFDVLINGQTSETSQIACNMPTTLGLVAFEIIAPIVNELKITYDRPLYAPGWTIYRDGVEVYSESSNRGTAQTPIPVTYSYALTSVLSPGLTSSYDPSHGYLALDIPAGSVWSYSHSIWTTPYAKGDNTGKTDAFNLQCNRVTVVMTWNGNSRTISWDHGASKSLHEIFSSNTFIRSNVPVLDWRNFLGSGVAGWQNNCNRQGFNMVISSKRRARFGIGMNQENDCNSPDSSIGVGLGDIGSGASCSCCSNGGTCTVHEAAAKIYVNDCGIDEELGTEREKPGYVGGCVVATGDDWGASWGIAPGSIALEDQHKYQLVCTGGPLSMTGHGRCNQFIDLGKTFSPGDCMEKARLNPACIGEYISYGIDTEAEKCFCDSFYSGSTCGADFALSSSDSSTSLYERWGPGNGAAGYSRLGCYVSPAWGQARSSCTPSESACSWYSGFPGATGQAGIDACHSSCASQGFDHFGIAGNTACHCAMGAPSTTTTTGCAGGTGAASKMDVYALNSGPVRTPPQTSYDALPLTLIDTPTSQWDPELADVITQGGCQALMTAAKAADVTCGEELASIQSLRGVAGRRFTQVYSGRVGSIYGNFSNQATLNDCADLCDWDSNCVGIAYGTYENEVTVEGTSDGLREKDCYFVKDLRDVNANSRWNVWTYKIAETKGRICDLCAASCSADGQNCPYIETKQYRAESQVSATDTKLLIDNAVGQHWCTVNVDKWSDYSQITATLTVKANYPEFVAGGQSTALWHLKPLICRDSDWECNQQQFAVDYTVPYAWGRHTVAIFVQLSVVRPMSLQLQFDQPYVTQTEKKACEDILPSADCAVHKGNGGCSDANDIHDLWRTRCVQTCGYCDDPRYNLVTCKDGIQNGFETGVDCGGFCLPCVSERWMIMDSVDVANTEKLNFLIVDHGIQVTDIVLNARRNVDVRFDNGKSPQTFFAAELERVQVLRAYRGTTNHVAGYKVWLNFTASGSNPGNLTYYFSFNSLPQTTYPTSKYAYTDQFTTFPAVIEWNIDDSSSRWVSVMTVYQLGSPDTQYTVSLTVSDPVIDDYTCDPCGTGGGDTLILSGKYFEPKVSPRVTVGGGNCTNVIISASGQQLSCVMPPGSGAENVILVSAKVDQVGAPYHKPVAYQFLAYDPPAVTEIVPSVFSTSGTAERYELGIKGFSLSKNPQVKLDGVLTECQQIAQDVFFQCQVPQGYGRDLLVEVVVSGQAMISAPLMYSYTNPSIVSIDPVRVDTSGGQTLTITGNNFYTQLSLLQVTVGDQVCSNLQIALDHTQLTCTLPPAQTFGETNIKVELNSATSNEVTVVYNQPEGFNHSGVFPTEGAVEVVVTGKNFGVVKQDLVMSIPPKPVSVTITPSQWTDTSFTFTLPKGQGGATVSFASDPSINFGFDYDKPEIINILSTNAKTDGTGTVTITGTNFGLLESKTDVVVEIGGLSSEVLSVGAGGVVCTLPANTGQVAVIISIQGRDTGAVFVYDAPQIDSVTGPLSTFGSDTNKNEKLTINGANFGDQAGVVELGGNVCVVVSWSEREVVCEAPAGEGSVEVTVRVGQTDNPTPYRHYYDSPRVTNVQATNGLSTKGGQLVVTGFNFGQNPTVLLTKSGNKTIACQNPQVPQSRSSADSGDLFCVLGPGTGTDWTVVVKQGNQGKSNDEVITFSFPKPVVDADRGSDQLPKYFSILPNGAGELSCADNCNFGTDKAAVTVSVGGIESSPSSVVHDRITFAMPNLYGTGIPVIVTVDSQSSSSVDIAYYKKPLLKWVKCSGGRNESIVGDFVVGAADCPTQGPITVTIVGQYFGPDCTSACNYVTVQIGGVAGENVAVGSEGIVCDLPARPTGGLGLEVQVFIGQEAENKPRAFSYAAPIISSVSISTSSSAEGTEITIAGQDFGTSPTVTFGPESNTGLFGLNCTATSTPGELVCITLQRLGGTNFSFVLTTSSGIASALFFSDIQFGQPEIVSFDDGATTLIGSQGSGEILTLIVKHVGLERSAVRVIAESSTVQVEFSVERVDPHTDPESSLVVCKTVPGEESVPFAFTVIAWGLESDANLNFTYPSVPIIANVTGCPGDLCPTIGQETLTLEGSFNIPNDWQQTDFDTKIDVVVGVLDCKNIVVVSGNTQITCTLPPGTGKSVPVVLTVNGKSSAPYLISFRAPIISGVYKSYNLYTPSSNEPASRMNRTAQDVITIVGQDFGETGSVVLVGGSECSDVQHGPGHSIVTCNLPEGEGTEKSVLLIAGSQLSSPGGVMSYEPCGVGTFVPEVGNTTCVPCAEGSFTRAEGQANCFACDKGSFANSTGQSRCKLCEAGQFSGAGAPQCEKCPPGTYNPVAGSGECQECEAGAYSESNSKKCVACEKGKFSSQSRAGNCNNCTAGTYAATKGQSICRACEDGTFQDNRAATTCKACPKGEYAQNDNGQVLTKCEACPRGKAAGSERQSECTPCKAGTYANGTRNTVCTACDVGRVAPQQGMGGCDECQPGTWMGATGQERCLDCPAGNSCPDSGTVTPKKCPGGTETRSISGTTTKATECSNCSAGMFSTDAVEGCLKCEPGTFAEIGGLFQCRLCNPGTSQDHTGKESCEPCAEGKVASSKGALRCIECGAGRASMNGVNCSTCTVGTSTGGEDGQSSCESCPGGKYAPVQGAADCVKCDPGFYQSGADNPANCTSCLPGTYQDKIGQEGCKNCTKGFFAAYAGSLQCDDCKAGTFSDSPGATLCSDCDAGKKAPEAQATVCKDCENGRFQSTTRQPICEDCPAGKFQEAGNFQNCTDCPIGKANEDSRQVACQDCVAGKFMSATGEVQCLVCPAGKYSDDNATACKDCGPGKFYPGDKLTGVPECKMCAAGLYAEANGTVLCRPCQTGFYADEVGSSTCKYCQEGSYSKNVGFGSSQCTLCSPGEFAPNERSGSCTACPQGTYQNETGKASCIDADPGYFVNLTASASQTPCEVGKYQEEGGQDECNQCGPGTYQWDIGKVSCIDADAGYHVAAFGSMDQRECPVGQYQEAIGQSECNLCVPGRYTNKNATLTCTDCPQGRAQKAEASTSCDICRAGTEAAPGQPECSECKDNSVSQLAGTDCIPCPDDAAPNEFKTACLCEIGFASRGTKKGVVPNTTNTTGPTTFDQYNECATCPKGAVCVTTGVAWDEMEARVGWWRGSDLDEFYSDEGGFYACRNDIHCPGGMCASPNNNETSCCVNHREGPVCARLEVGFVNDYRGRPKQCDDNQGSTVAYIVSLVLAVLLGIVLMFYITIRSVKNLILADEMESELASVTSQGFEVELDPTFATKRLRHGISYDIYGGGKAKANYTYKLKILIGFLQIVVSMVSTLEIGWPLVVKRFLRIFNIFKFDLFAAAEVDCLVKTTYYQRLFVTATVPAVVLFVIVILFVIPRYLAAAAKENPARERKSVRQMFWRLVYVSMFLLYPVVSAVVVRLYAFRTVQGVSYLADDFNILRTDPDWERAALINITFVLLWPIGIPVIFALTLRKYRDRLDEPGVRAAVGYLYDGYERDTYWFELIEMMHKLALTSLLVFFPTEHQMPAAIVIALLYTIIVLLRKPMLRKGDDRLQLICQAELLNLFLAAHVYYWVDFENQFTEDIIGISLICAMLFFGFSFLATAGYAFLKVARKSKIGQAVEGKCCGRTIKTEKTKHARNKTTAEHMFDGIETDRTVPVHTKISRSGSELNIHDIRGNPLADLKNVELGNAKNVDTMKQVTDNPLSRTASSARNVKPGGNLRIAKSTEMKKESVFVGNPLSQ